MSDSEFTQSDPQKSFSRSAWFVLLLAAVLASVSCGKPTEETTVHLPRPVKTFEVHNGGIEKVMEFPGLIAAYQETSKAFEVPGRIKDELVKEGRLIKKEEVLARLDPRDYEFVRDSAKAQFEAAKSVAERLRGLVEKQSVSLQQVELAVRDLSAAKAALDKAEKALEDTELKADFDGKVAKVLVKDFANVQAKENIMIIQDDSVLEIKVQVPESVFAIPIEGETSAEKVAKTNPVVILSALPDRAFPATFSEASEIPDPVSRTYEVTLTFVPPDDDLIQPGMTAKVRGTIPPNSHSHSQGYAVPVNAVISGDNDARVWKIDPDTLTVSQVSVEPGAVVGDSIVITGGLQGGDLIAASGVHHLREGQPIRLWEKK